MSNVLDKIIEDLVKGASRNTRDNGGPGVNIVVARENRGHEEKLAGHPGVGAAFAGPLGAALGADEGHELEAAKGSFMGGLKGTGIGALGGGGLGALAAALGGGSPIAGLLPGALLGGGLGSYIGNVAGAAKTGALFGGAGGLMAPAAAAASMLSGGGAAVRPKGPAKPPPLPQAALDRMHASSPFAAVPKMGSSYDSGTQAALEAFGVKEAFLPAIAAIGARLAPMAARALPAIGRAFGAAKPALGRAGGFLMNHPVGQQIAGTAASNVVNRAMTPQQPQPM